MNQASNLTYKNDDSFFMHVVIPGNPHRYSLFNWFESTDNCKYRFIRDTEIEENYWSIDQIHNVYPGIKTIAIVFNPYARAKFAYDQICGFKQAGDQRKIPANTFEFNLNSFEDFILSYDEAGPSEQYWYNMTTCQVDWLYKGGYSPDYILKAENIVEDMKVINDYFISDKILELRDEIPDYKDIYSAKTKAIIEKLFADDFKAFGYKF